MMHDKSGRKRHLGALRCNLRSFKESLALLLSNCNFLRAACQEKPYCIRDFPDFIFKERGL
jgi:hypothetical protein